MYVFYAINIMSRKCKLKKSLRTFCDNCDLSHPATQSYATQPYCHTASQPHSNTRILPYDHIATQPHWHTIIQARTHTATQPHMHTAAFTQCPIATQPASHSAT